MKNILLILCSLVSFSSFAQNGNYNFSGARSAAMGNAGISFQDINGFLQNPAAIGQIADLQIITAAEQRFLIEDLNQFSTGIAIPTNSGSFGLVFDYFGFDAYNEQKIGLAYARKIAKNIALGVQFDYLNTFVEEYGNKGVFTFEIGFQFQISKELRFASQFFNPIQSKILEDENLPSVLKLGLAYEPVKSLLVVLEVEKDIDIAARTKVGFDYQFVEKINLRAGVSTHPTSMTFGMGFQIQDFIAIDVASKYHQTLGFSPSLSLIYRRKKK